VDTIGADEKEEGRSLKELAPIASVAACDALIGHLLPQARWDRLDWRALPRATWWRLCLPELHWPLVAASALYWQVGAWSALALLWWPWSAFMAMRRARRMAYAVDGELVAVREGWWHRHWRFAERDKLQALGLTRSPLDRCCGTATLWLDTAGAGALGPPLRIRFLPEAEARRQPLRW
jgi:putative membrane protein